MLPAKRQHESEGVCESAGVLNEIQRLTKYSRPDQNEHQPGKRSPSLNILCALSLPHLQLHLFNALLEFFVESYQERNFLN